MKVTGVAPAELEAVWPQVALMLSDALAHSGESHTLNDVRQSLEREESMLWLVTDAVDSTIAALVSYANEERNALTVWLMSGSALDEWVDDVQPLLVRYARERGLPYADAYMRPGLARRLKAHGWHAVQVIARIEVEEDERRRQRLETVGRTDGNLANRAAAMA
jgi:hypothetical protein